MILEGAIVMRSTGSWYLIRTKEGEEVEARIKGKFRMQGIKTTNPVAVGDLVDFTLEMDSTAVITKIHPRKNYIIRKSVNLSKQAQIIACNIDRALLVVTISNPVTQTGFIDRFLITAEAYHIPVTIVFNKIDIYSEKDQLKLDELIIAYEPIWAIGSGITPKPKEVNSMHVFIKDVVQSATANNIVPKVLYGGSVNDTNAADFFEEESIDGALVGGASMDANVFANIVNIYKRLKRI